MIETVLCFLAPSSYRSYNPAFGGHIRGGISEYLSIFLL